MDLVSGHLASEPTPCGYSLSTCSPPEKVSGMRSSIGAYKMLSRVLPQCASYTTPLDAVTAGRESYERIKWTDHLCKSFHVAQSALASSEIITLPQPEDQLWLLHRRRCKEAWHRIHPVCDPWQQTPARWVFQCQAAWSLNHMVAL